MKSIFLASIALAVLGLLATWLLRRFRIQSPLLHRLAWGLVLLQGVIFAGFTFDLPVLKPIQISEFVNQTSPVLPTISNASTPTEITAPAPLEIAKPSANAFSVSLPAIYFSGICLTLAFFVAAYLALILAVRKTRPAPEKWRAQWNAILERNAHEADSIPLQIHPRLGPMLCRLPGGYTVVVPEQPWGRLTEQQREAVLEHELAHVERRDIWKTLVARLVAMLHWFNPMAWWSARQFEEAAEWDCDRRLSAKGKRHAVEYARALLEFAEPKSPLPIGAALARGAALSPRIRRLTSGSADADTWLRRVGFATLLGAIAFVAMFRFDLIAQESNATPGEVFKKDLREFSESIEGDAETVANFRATIKTPAGQIVMKELATQTQKTMLESKMSTALEDHLDRYFDRDAATEKLTLKPEAAEFKTRLQQSAATFSSDIEKLKPAMAELRANLSEDSDAGKLLARFLDQEGAAEWLYSKALREQIRPGAKMIMKRLDGKLVPGKDGKFVVPPSRVDQVTRIVDLGAGVLKLHEALGDELVTFSDDVAETDELHKRVKAAMKNPEFTLFICAEMADDIAEKPVAACIDKLFKGLEEGFFDQADGLQIVPDAKEQFAALIEKFEGKISNLSTIREALAGFSSRISEKDDFHKEVKRVLGSEAAVMLFAHEGGEEIGEPGYAFRALLAEVLESKKDGKQSVVDAKQDELSAQMMEALRTLREAKRKGRQFDQLTAKIDDTELKEIYQSSVGKMIVVQMIRDELEQLTVDGLSLWIDLHFDKNEAGKRSPKAATTEIIAMIVKRSKEISENLKSDF